MEPITPTIVRQCVQLAQQGTATIRGTQWSLHNKTCFMVTAWEVVNMPVGSRKGESTRLPGDVDSNDWFDRASVSCERKGRVYVDPSPDVWASLREGDYVLLAPKGSKCDTWGTCHGTEPIVLPFHDDDLNAARWIRDIELRYPVRGTARAETALFASEDGGPFSDATFAAYIKAVLQHVLGVTKARLYSPHSWRVWLATSLRMCDASDARIQAFGRWLNPASIKIYARMTKAEYAEWVDKMMKVRHIDTARTTNLPIMDTVGAIAMWGQQLDISTKHIMPATPRDTAPAKTPPPSPLKNGDRVSVYWTEIQEWHVGTFTSSRVEVGDDGALQRASRIVYDRQGRWTSCSTKALTYWHCLDDEVWQRA